MKEKNPVIIVSPSDITETHIPTLLFLKNQQRYFQNSQTVGEATGNEIGNVAVGRRREWWCVKAQVWTQPVTSFHLQHCQTHPPHLDADLIPLYHRRTFHDIEFKTKIQFCKLLGRYSKYC